MNIIPIRSIPNQTLSVSLEQNCIINIFTRNNNLYVDINANGEDMVTSVIAKNLVPLVCIAYTGFLGNLIFFDTKGDHDPEYISLGDRYKLIYITKEEYELISK